MAGCVETLDWPAKDPGEVLDYRVNWTERLTRYEEGIAVEVDTINSGEVTLATAAGLVIDSESVVGAESIVWLSGGTTGQTAIILARIVTGAGRTMEQSVRLPIRDK